MISYNIGGFTSEGFDVFVDWLDNRCQADVDSLGTGQGGEEMAPPRLAGDLFNRCKCVVQRRGGRFEETDFCGAAGESCHLDTREAAACKVLCCATESGRRSGLSMGLAGDNGGAHCQAAT